MSVRSLAARLIGRSPRRSSALRSPQHKPLGPDRLEFSVEGDAAVVRVRLGKARHGVAELQVQRSQGDVIASYPFNAVSDDQLATVSVDLADLVRTHHLSETAHLYVSWERTNKDGTAKVARQRVGGFAETVRPPRAQLAVIDGVEVRLEVTVRGNLVIRVDDDPGTGVRLSVSEVVWRGDQVEICCDVKTGNRAALSASTVVLGRLSRTRVELPAPLVPLDRLTREDNGLLHFEVRPKIDTAVLARELPATDELLDVTIELTVEGRPEPVLLQVRFADDLTERRLQTTITEQHGMTHLFMPYLTYRTQRFAYRTERFRTDDYRYLRRLLRVAWLFPLIKPFTRIWLIGEVPYKAQDNGFHFFRWLRTQRPRRRAYYVIDPNSPDREKLAPLGNVIDRGSRRHMLFSLLASRLVSSHHAEYLFASRHDSVARRTRGVRIFLQHGITAAKNVTAIYARQRTLELPTERFVVASELERRIVTEDYGYRRSQVPVAGFARFDALFAAHDRPDRTLLVMPTWREGLRASTLADTDYYRQWHGFLSDLRFRRLIEQHNMRVRLVLHPNLRTLAEFFEFSHVELIRQDEVDVQQLITSSALLITDYSSVAWDFSFLRRPVLYFQFDQDVMSGGRAPHIDFVEQLPGPVVASIDGLVDAVSTAVERDCVMEERYWERAQVFVGFRDQRNCERIERVVATAWGPTTLLNRIRNARSAQRHWWRFRTGPRYFVWMRRLYGLASILPRSSEVMFECDRGRHFGDSPRYLYERLVLRSKRPAITWANNTTLRLTDPRTRKIQRHSPTYYWRLGRARYWVNNQNFPPDLAKPARTTFLQTWHGTPLKRMQHDVANMAGRDAEYQQRAARLTSYWDLLLSGSAYATSCFRSAFRFTGPILEEGYPRNDIFSWPDAHVRAHHAKQRLGLDGDPRTVMFYAPTFRDDNRPDANWRHDLALDIPRLATELGDDHVLIVRFHPLVRESMKSLIAAHPGFVIDGSAYNDIQELLLISDVLITDYSSVFFDYSVLQRPILFFTYDLDHYRDELRGFYMDLETEAPGPVLMDNDALIDALSHLDEVREQYRDRLREFRAAFAPRDDGRASDRVLDAVFGDAIDRVDGSVRP